MFIIPTIVFLIVFNIFALLYSPGYSFTDFRASTSAPANFVGLDKYRRLLADPFIWKNFTITAKYVIVSVTGQVGGLWSDHAYAQGRGRNHVRRVADVLQIGGPLNRHPSALSGGDLQRVAIGRAIVRTPKVFLMDEPLSALDAKLSKALWAELKPPDEPGRPHPCAEQGGAGAGRHAA